MANNRIRVLHLKNSPADAALVEQMLTDEPEVIFDLRQSPLLSTELDGLGDGDADIVLLDLPLQDSD